MRGKWLLLIFKRFCKGRLIIITLFQILILIHPLFCPGITIHAVITCRNYIFIFHSSFSTTYIIIEPLDGDVPVAI